jgi:hypothetical protein
VRLVRATKEGFVLHLGKREKPLFCDLLKLYPRIPSTHRANLSKTGQIPNQQENQRLLEDALKESRRENRKKVLRLLEDVKTFHELDTGWQLNVSNSDLEWLLQVLNDIRVGSWLRLGSPASLLLNSITEENALDYWAMEVSGHLQMQLLAVTQGKASR